MSCAPQNLGLKDCAVRLFFLRCLRSGLCAFHVFAFLCLPWYCLVAGFLLHLFILRLAASYVSLLCPLAVAAFGPPPVQSDPSASAAVK